MRNSEQGTPSRWGRLILTSSVAVVTTIVVVRYVGDKQVSRAQAPTPSAQAVQQTSTPIDQELLNAEGLSRAFRTAAQKVLPAVVVIKAGTSPVCPRCGRAHDTVEKDDAMSSDVEQQRSLDILGSGFLVAPTGIVLTNKHVVGGNRRLVVQTADGKQFPVRQVKTDQEHDVAVLSIETRTMLPFVSLGDSEKAEIGDWVLTIGCPLELEQTVSAGIISAKNRSFCPKHQTRYLQTDAVVNPGSSGGPLVALNGTVIGITTSIASDDGGYQGIGFAVPASFLKPLLTQFNEASAKDSSPLHRKANEVRWLGSGGSRWGVDSDGDGKINYWKVLSPEEAMAEVVAALANCDWARFAGVLLMPREVQTLGLATEKAHEMVTRLRRAGAAFKPAAAQQKTVPPDSKMVQFSGGKPEYCSGRH